MGTGVLKLLGGESGTGVYGVAQTRTRLLGRRTLNPQAVKQVLSECAIPTSRQNLLQIQYLNPLPVARAPYGSKVTYNFGPCRHSRLISCDRGYGCACWQLRLQGKQPRTSEGERRDKSLIPCAAEHRASRL